MPASAHSGKIMLLLGGGRYTSSYGPISIVRYALHPPAPKPQTPPQALASSPSGTAFDGQGMWIWYLSQSEGGNLAAIAARAHAAGSFDGVRQELGRLDQLLEPVQPRTRQRSCTRTG